MLLLFGYYQKLIFVQIFCSVIIEILKYAFLRVNVKLNRFYYSLDDLNLWKFLYFVVSTRSPLLLHLLPVIKKVVRWFFIYLGHDPIENVSRTQLMPLVLFCTSRKHQKTEIFLMFSGGIEWDQWHKMA